jgi:hypothetical protein
MFLPNLSSIFKKSVLKLLDRTVSVKPFQIKDVAFHTCAASEGTNSLVEYLIRLHNILCPQYIRCHEILHWIECRPLSNDSDPAPIFLLLTT